MLVNLFNRNEDNLKQEPHIIKHNVYAKLQACMAAGVSNFANLKL